MAILVTYASRHESTRGIAEGVAETLRRAGKEVRILPVEEVTDPTGHEAVVIGSAVYYGRWMKPATRFVQDHQSTLCQRPVWLFSSGPIDTQPKTDPTGIDELRQAVRAVDHRTFYGAMHRAALKLGERLVTKALKAPDGDYRDWADINAWAETIVRHLDADGASGADRADRSQSPADLGPSFDGRKP
jgi:menaquinone-dependent protoporphyrinogen oxidase